MFILPCKTMNQIDNNCCSSCYSNKGCECPNIIWSGQIDISSINENEINIFAPENPTITSTDWTVQITETLNSPWSINYDLSVEWQDNKVGACITDPNPSSLDNKIFVNSPLTKSVQDCASDGKIVLWINTALLADEKVKVASWCSSVYLENAILWVDGIRTYKDACTMKIDVDPAYFVKPMAKVMLSADTEITKTHGTMSATQDSWWFFLPTNVIIDNNTSWRTDWITYQNITTTLWTLKSIKINKSWYYRVSFNANADINFGINAMRTIVWSNMPWKTIVLDDKIWTTVWYAIASNATANARFNIDQAEQISFSRSWITFLEAGTNLFLWWRISPYVITWPWSWINAWALYRRAWLAEWTLSNWLQTENSEAGTELTVEWVCDENWWLLYI